MSQEVFKTVPAHLGMKVSRQAPFIPLKKRDDKVFGHCGFSSYQLDPLTSGLVILENASDDEVLSLVAGCQHLRWPAHSIAVHLGQRGEQPVIRQTVDLAGTYVIVATFSAEGLNDKQTEVSVSLNGQTIRIAASPDVFTGQIDLVAGDFIDLSTGLLPGSDYTDSTVLIAFNLYYRTQEGKLFCLDEGRSGIPPKVLETAGLDLSAAPVFSRENQARTSPSWYYRTFQSLLRNDDVKHLEACYRLPLSDIYEKLLHQHIVCRAKYVIFFTPRSGSSLLTECLAQTGHLGYPMEFLVEHYHLALSQLRCDAEMLTPLDFAQSKFCTPNGVFGIEIDYYRNSLFHAPIIENLKEWSVAYMTRRDLLAQAISWFVADQFGHWNVYSLGMRTPLYDRSQILHHLYTIVFMMQEFEAHFAANDVQPLRIEYEGFLQDVQKTVSSFANLAGVSLDVIPTVDVAEAAQKKLSGNLSRQWAMDVLTTGGDYLGYSFEQRGADLYAVLAGANISALHSPENYAPLAFKGATQAEIERRIDQFIDEHRSRGG